MLGILFGAWKGPSVLSSKKVSVRFHGQHPNHRVKNSKAMLFFAYKDILLDSP